MRSAPSILPSYSFTNSSAPEKATWLMYLSISSAVIPIPRSIMLSVFAFLSTLMWMVKSPNSPLASPRLVNVLSFCVASTALETSSRRKISWSLYKNFLIIGKMFCAVTLIDPLDMFFLFRFSTIGQRLCH